MKGKQRKNDSEIKNIKEEKTRRDNDRRARAGKGQKTNGK